MLFSSTVGMGGSYQHITLIGKGENQKKHNCLTFCVEKSLFGEGDKSKMCYRVLDTCIIKDKLIILRENGLFFIDLVNNVSEKNLVQIDNNEKEYNKIIKINNENCIILNEKKYELLTL
jgi:hypothetical protein